MSCKTATLYVRSLVAVQGLCLKAGFRCENCRLAEKQVFVSRVTNNENSETQQTKDSKKVRLS